MLEQAKLLTQVLETGDRKQSRAGPVLSLHHLMVSHDMRNGFPVLTGRKFAFKTMAAELECFVKGTANINEFHARNCHIWDANLADFNMRTGWANNKDLGPIYGNVWRGRHPNGPDQLTEMLDDAVATPLSRRLLVTAWLPGVSNDPMRVALPPCHVLWQISIFKPYVDLCFYMRSVDLALGLPFDVASYGLLQCLIGRQLKLTPRRLTGFLADAHVYESNLPGVWEYLARPTFDLPTLVLDPTSSDQVVDFDYRACSLENYQSGAPIAMKMAV